MKIIADEEIPFVSHYFGHCGQIIFKQGRTLTRNDLLDADILLARSVTQINQSLLEGTSVRFVGSTVTGLDHIDTDWLEQQGIRWANAPGCNADAVAEYAVCVIAALQQAEILSTNKIRAGVIGVGKIGSRVVEKLKLLNVDVVQCDPVRAENENDFVSTPLDQFSDLDFITLHTPLTHGGKYPTFHMIDKKFLRRQKPGCILLNTGRGAAINFEDLKNHGRHLKWCFDVWEHEPEIDREILNAAVIATQHIAGHSIQAKYRGIEMVYQKALEMGVIPNEVITPINYPKKTISFSGKKMEWRDVILGIFDVLKYTQYIKSELLNSKKTFDQLRKEFTDHYEFGFVEIQQVNVSREDRGLLQRLGFVFDV